MLLHTQRGTTNDVEMVSKTKKEKRTARSIR